MIRGDCEKNEKTIVQKRNEKLLRHPKANRPRRNEDDGKLVH